MADVGAERRSRFGGNGWRMSERSGDPALAGADVGAERRSRFGGSGWRMTDRGWQMKDVGA